MKRKNCIAIVLAGDKGEKLGALTGNMSKPAVHFGGKYRIIDFTLSNCVNSGISVLGVMTKYKPMELHKYINRGHAWSLDEKENGISLLYSSGAIEDTHQSIRFIERFNPENVLVLSGGHVYKMNYGNMIAFHKETNADVTIAAKVKNNSPVPIGAYAFRWDVLRDYLLGCNCNFGVGIVQSMALSGCRAHTYLHGGYWNNMGTLRDLWESNMELVKDSPELDLSDDAWRIFTNYQCAQPGYIWNGSEVKNSIISQGCAVFGNVSNSVLSNSVVVSSGAEITNSVIFPNVIISKNAKIRNSIVGAYASIGENSEIGGEDGLEIFYDDEICSKGISLVAPGVYIDENTKIKKNSNISRSTLLNELVKTRIRKEYRKSEFAGSW